MANIKATIRNETGKAKIKKIRRTGKLPAIMYGHGDPSLLLTVSTPDFQQLLKQLRGRAPLVDVEIEGQNTVRCIIKTVQRNPIDGTFLHVDFQKVHPEERITIAVPVIIKGVAEGVKQGGMLEQILREIPVRATIDKIPEHFEIDVTTLKMGHSIHIADLKYEGIDFELPPDSAIVTILTPRKLAAAIETPTAPTAAEPEVIKEKKEEEAPAEEEGKEGKKGKAAEPAEKGKGKEKKE